MSKLRILYLCLSIIGAVVPMIFLLGWTGANGFGLSGLLAAWTINGATTALTWDLAISAVALTVFAFTETVVRKDRLPLLAIPATFLIGLSCGLPLYLFLRSRPMD
ncbi:MAG: DUF2834 domain-containing protein [Rhodobacteraceae bacterium]|nr:DUF2834 domain-containing protein [Paracoccaceae bacterium]